MNSRDGQPHSETSYAHLGVRLHQLEGFYHTCKYQGFARAVAAMPYSITESALHQQVRKLEGSLGHSLLKRAPSRRMIPTAEGRLLYEFVAPYFDGIEQVLRGVAQGQGAKFIIGVEPMYVDQLCAPAIAHLTTLFSTTTVQVRECDVQEIATQVLAGDVDLGLSSLPNQLDSQLLFEELGSISLALLVPKNHELAKSKTVPSAAALEQYSFIVYQEGTEGRGYTDAAAAALNTKLKIAAEGSSAESMRSMVRAGVAPAFVPTLRNKKDPTKKLLPDGIVEFDFSKRVTQHLELPQYGLISKKGHSIHEGLKCFCESIRSWNAPTL